MQASKQEHQEHRDAHRRAAFLGVVLVVSVVFSAGAQSSEPGTTEAAVEPATGFIEPAVQRLSRTLAAVAESAPEVAASQDEASARAAMVRAEVHTFDPFLELQREGMGTNLDDRPNTAFYVRLGTTLPLPGEKHQRRRLESSLTEWLSARGIAQSTQVVVAAGDIWLQLAALEERLALHGDRLQRLERALELQRKRLELGEVAGLEVVQLQAEHGAESIRLRALRTEVVSVRAQLRELAGDGMSVITAGDLGELVSQLPSLPSNSELDHRLVESPLLQASRADAEKERDLADLRQTLAWGRPEIDVEWERVPSVDGGPSFTAIGFRLHVPLPFGSVGRERQARAEFEASAATSRLHQAERLLVRRWRVALEVLDSAAAALDGIAPLLADLPAAEQSLAEQFRLGAISYLVLLDGMRRLDEVRLAVVEARLDLLRARLEVAALLGDSNLFPLPAPTVVVSTPEF